MTGPIGILKASIGALEEVAAGVTKNLPPHTHPDVIAAIEAHMVASWVKALFEHAYGVHITVTRKEP